MKAALRWIASSLPLMILALVLALLAWFVAVEEVDPTIEERYSQLIPVTLSGLPEGMMIVGDTERGERVQVTIRAPQSVWDALEVDDFSATVDLTNVSAGIHELPIQVTLDRQPSRVVLFEPQVVTLKLDVKVRRSVPVRVRIEGEPTLGYLRRKEILDPSEVMVSGPNTFVTQVAEAVTSISVHDATTDVEGEFQLRLRDSGGQLVPYVTLTPETVAVRIPIAQSSYYRSLPVKVVLEGQVAPGYLITEIAVEPPTVTLFGTPDALSALPGFIETEPIDVEGVQADVVERPLLSVSPGVAIVPGQRLLEVEVSVEAVQSSLTVDITPELRGLGASSGFTATVSSESVEVILSGPLPLLETLEADDVRIILDLFGLPLGTYQIEPQMVLPEGLTAQSINPATVQVEIALVPSPTPTEQ